MNKAKLAVLQAQGITLSKHASLMRQAKVLCEAPVNLGCEIGMQGAIGAFSYARPGGRLSSGVKAVGRYCSISSGVVAGDSNHPTDWLSTHPFQYGAGAVFTGWTKCADFDFMRMPRAKRAVTIGNDVWIGANAIILPGVGIGDGAVIGAGAVVSADVPPYAVVAGVPARVLRYRFDEQTIERLLELRWWRFEADSLLGVDFSNIDKSIRQVQEREAAGLLVAIQREPVLLTAKGVGGV